MKWATLLGRLLRKFAEGSRQYAGEFSHPREAGLLMVHLLDPKEEEIHDPDCSPRGLPINSRLPSKERKRHESLQDSTGRSKPVYLYNSKDERLCPQHGIIKGLGTNRVQITLILSKTARSNSLKLIANPMWNQKPHDVLRTIPTTDLVSEYRHPIKALTEGRFSTCSHPLKRKWSWLLP